jgi:SPP1 family predicted phage head-tail adaptor
MISHQAGEFNTLVAIEQLQPPVDAVYGSKAATWVLFASWWCRINPISGQEAYANQAIEAKANFKLDGSFVAGVTARMRVNDHGALYDITSPPLDWDNRHRYMTLLAKTGIDRG